MRIVVVGATGTIGKEVCRALAPGNDIVEVSRSHTAITVDISDPASIREMYRRAGKVDAVVSAAGKAMRRPLLQLTDEDFEISLRHKLMGQVNLVRYGIEHVHDGGSFTLTSGILARRPMVGSEALSMVNIGLEGFARAAALELPRGIRINVVSPPWIAETLRELKMTGVPGLPAAEVARAYAETVYSKETGGVIEPVPRPV
jgi:NAD(P)-dependent dehydrogenase (short-subunit alcohol dehydrogenase family)